MTIGGWISMTLAIGATTGLLVWCCWKITTTPDASSDGADDEQRR